MSPISLKRDGTPGLMALVSAGMLLTALAAHPQTVTGNSASNAQSSPSSSAQSGQSSASGRSTPMGSAADASGNAGSSKLGAKSSGSDASSGAQGGKIAKADADFMKDIAYSNISELATAKLALANSQNDQVKTFAQKMIDDHTKAQQELEQLAQSKGVTLPKEPDTKHKAASKALEKLKGDKFDAMYMKQAGENDHQKTHKLLDKVAKKTKDQDLKAYVTKTMGPVDEHLKMANQMKADRKGGKAAAKGSGTGADSTAEKAK